MSIFQMLEMEIFISNGSFCVFLPNFAQKFLYTQNDHTKRKNLLNTQNGNFQVK